MPSIFGTKEFIRMEVFIALPPDNEGQEGCPSHYTDIFLNGHIS